MVLTFQVHCPTCYRLRVMWIIYIRVFQLQIKILPHVEKWSVTCFIKFYIWLLASVYLALQTKKCNKTVTNQTVDICTLLVSIQPVFKNYLNSGVLNTQFCYSLKFFILLCCYVHRLLIVRATLNLVVLAYLSCDELQNKTYLTLKCIWNFWRTMLNRVWT